MGKHEVVFGQDGSVLRCLLLLATVWTFLGLCKLEVRPTLVDSLLIFAWLLLGVLCLFGDVVALLVLWQ